MWLENVVDALNKSKSQKLILLVYLSGENEQSQAMIKQLENDESIKVLISNKTIALKLLENSQNARMFHQIYPVETSPAIYLISHNGKLLEKFLNTLDKELFIRKLNEFSSLTDQNLVKGIPVVSSSNESTNNVASINQVSTESVQTAINKDAKSIEEKKKELLERVREKNKKEDEDHAKNKEMERIKAGKAIQKLRKENEEREAAELIKQREKDALFDKIERERVLRQIEEDQQEKKARFELERLKREKEYNEYQKLQAEKNSSLKNRVIRLKDNEIRIQFKLPEGTTLINKFKADDSLQIAVDYLKENSNLKNFNLAITYPKQNFSDQDFMKKFNELGIKNSAVLLVIDCGPVSKSTLTEVVDGSVFGKIWQFVLASCLFLYNLITGLFRSVFGNNDSNRNTSDDNRPPYERRNLRSNFGDLDQDDNRKNTYNGNSTEQM